MMFSLNFADVKNLLNFPSVTTHQKMAKPDVMSTIQDKKGPPLKPTKIGRLKKYFFIHLIRKSVYFCMLILFQSLSYFWWSRLKKNPDSK